jgi:hypothetical protein
VLRGGATGSMRGAVEAFPTGCPWTVAGPIVGVRTTLSGVRDWQAAPITMNGRTIANRFIDGEGDVV